MRYIKTYEQRNTNLLTILTEFSNSKHKDYDELKRLILKHKDLINVGFLLYKPISIAISSSDIKMLQILIEFGADVNLPISHDITPIYEAVVSDNIEIIRMLIKAGADVNIGCTGINQPPLILAFNRYTNSVREDKNLDIVHELIKAGADWSLKDSTNANRNHEDFIYYTDFYKMTDYFIKRYPEEYKKYLRNKKAELYNL